MNNNNFDDIFKSTDNNAGKSYEPFDKGEWAEMKKIEREFAFNTIDETLENIKSSPEDYTVFLNVMSNFEKYSTGNILLITNQMPDATRLLDSKAISKAEGHVKKGERGIVLLEPGEEYTRDDGSTGVNFKTKKMFDISQTTVKAIQRAEVKYDNRILLKALIHDAPCKFELVDRVEDDRNAYYNPADNTIYIKENMRAGDIFRAVTQELAHAHLDTGDTTRQDNAFMAYSVAYVLCNKYGIATETFSFNKLPDRFANYDTKEMRKEVNMIRTVVNDISNDMAKLFEKQKADKSKDAR